MMFGDRRGVARCDLRRKWNVNGHRKQEESDKQYSQCAGAGRDSMVYWRRRPDNEVNRQSRVHHFTADFQYLAIMNM